MSSLSAAEAWGTYFQYIVGVSGALMAIAFLTFQSNLQVWRDRPLRQAVAVTTLAELATPMFFGLIFLMPGAHWKGGGAIVGVLGYAVMGWHVVLYRKNRSTADLFDKRQLKGMLITFITFSVMLCIPSLELKAYASLWFIFSGSCESWIFTRAN